MLSEYFFYFVSFHVDIRHCLSLTMSEVNVHQHLQHVLFIHPQKDVDSACQGIKLSASLSLCLFFPPSYFMLYEYEYNMNTHS